MDIHYNAFISYRHHPEDIRVATEIHHLLERFRIPRGLKSKVGKIDRIFRDKEELPITSNLTEDITAALRNSDYLIVICSVHTRESIWVQREIETFLQTHSRSQVLTVLCSGEPYDVIPEILLHEDVADPITGEMTRVDVEPLSCDWRIPARQARREELPRLAATLLGCGYDDLRQRQRHYRMRRLIAALSAVLTLSLGFAGYFLYTSITIQKANVQIQANLDEALRNQSLFLANAAQERLDAGDRLTAIALAMEALPEYPGERPYVPEAERVLSKALGLYRPEEIIAVGAIGQNTGNLIRDFWVSDYVKLAVLQDDRGVFTAWNTETMEKLATLPIDPYVSNDVVITKNNTVLVRAGSFETDIYAVTAEGTLLWKKSNCPDMAYLEDNTLLLLRKEAGRYELLYVNPETGEDLYPKMDISIPDTEVQYIKILAVGETREDVIALNCGNVSEDFVAVLWPEEGKTQIITSHIPYINCALITEAGKVLLMTPQDLHSQAGFIDGNRITAPQTYTITCYDPQTGGVLWKQVLKTNYYTGKNWMEQVPGKDLLLCVGGNVFQTLNLQNGTVFSSCEAGSGIMAINVEKNWTTYALQDGFIGIFNFGEDLCLERPYMEGNISQAAIRFGCYSLQKDGGQVTVYRSDEKDHLWDMSVEYFKEKQVCDNQLAVSSFGNLYMIDLERQRLLWQQENGSFEILGFSQDGSRLWTVKSKSELFTYSAADGTYTSVEFPEDLDGKSYLNGFGHALAGDTLYYLVCNNQEARLACWDLNTDEIRTVPIPGEILRLEEEFLFNIDLVDCNGEYLWFCADEQLLYAMNVQTGDTQLILEADQLPKIIGREGNRTVFCVGSKLYLYDGRECTLEISLEAAKGCSAALREEDFFVLCDNARVYRFDYSGNLLVEIEVVVYTDFATSVESAKPHEYGWYFLEDNKILVNALSVVSEIDCENWEISKVFSGFVNYDAEENELILKSGNALFGCTLYSTEELLEVAREQLKGYTLSEEQRRHYGIG